MIYLEIICTIPYIIFIVLLVRFIIKDCKSNIEYHRYKIGRYYFVDQYLPVEIKQSKDLEKICTQHQPFHLKDKTYIICNFPCNGICQFIKN